MSPQVESVLVKESAITLTLIIPVDFNADRPLAHLSNEGHIKEGLRQAGQVATERLYQTIADRHNAIDTYFDQEGYTLRQDDQSTQPFLSPYGHIQVLRPHFYIDYTRTSATPFEHETRMDQHRITPMMQYLILRKLMDHGPQACAQELDVPVSHHLLDVFLEDMGKRYQALKGDLTQHVLEEGWQPAWLHGPVEPDPGHGECPSAQQGTELTTDSAGPGSTSTPRAIPVVQVDAMSVTSRHYHETQEDGKTKHVKFHTERHHLYNAVVGFVTPEGAREAGDKIDLQHRRFFSHYRGRDELIRTVAQYLVAQGVKPGDFIICQADGDDNLWESLQAALKNYTRVEILDTEHARKNLKPMADLSYGQGSPDGARWVEKRMCDLYEGRYESFYNGLNYLIKRTPDPESCETLETKRAYFRRHRKRIRYAEFLELGYPISTCFVESAHRHVIGDRLRHHGRSYREDRLQMIADLRCEYKSQRLPYVFESLLEAAA